VVSQVHRFLSQQRPDTASPRVWVLHGPPIFDVYFHDLYHGCVSLRRTVELWGTEDWAGPRKPFTVTLTIGGELDFSGNTDPDDARARFDAMRNPRPPRFGHRRVRPAGEAAAPQGAAADHGAEPARRAEQTAAAAREHIGSGQELINRMQQVAAALKARNDDRIVVIVDELSHQLLRLRSLGQASSVLEAQLIVTRDWIGAINARNALLVFLEFSGSNIDPHVPPELAGRVRRLELSGPKSGEVREALLRTARRRHFRVRNPGAVATFLADAGDLTSALGLASRVVTAGQDLSLDRVINLPAIDETEVSAILAELDALTGLQSVKTKAREVITSARQRRRRLEETGDFPDQTLHMVFTGNPGTGKTTVARIFARLYHAVGLLPSERVTEANAAEGIKSRFVGATRENMQRKLEEAIGGVLFIDEAHQFGEASDPTSKEAVQAIVPMAWNHRNDLVIVLAGYSAQMDNFFTMDPGLERRFPPAGRFEFADYSFEELWTMTTAALARGGWTVDEAAVAGLRLLLQRRCGRGGFGNAGGVDNLVKEVIGRHDARGDGSRTITADDLPAIIVRHPSYIESAHAVLDALVGLSGIRNTVDLLVASLAYDLEEGRATGGGALRMLFVGPPGTGKTTVARLMADLLYGEGAIARPHLESTNGVSLHGSVMGETQKKVADLMERGRDGVVLIDEAYGLCVDERDTYGNQGLIELVGLLTNPRYAGTVVILAGYEPEINRLLARNDGLQRRFNTRVRFTNYTADECVEIAARVIAGEEFCTGTGFYEHFRDIADIAINEHGPQFGNAGWVRNAVWAAIAEMKRRVQQQAIAPGDPRRRTIELADLERATGTSASWAVSNDAGDGGAGPAGGGDAG
jgi:SpoVK/Ycf46/Vps4 family AAA+-type ATPase